MMVYDIGRSVSRDLGLLKRQSSMGVRVGFGGHFEATVEVLCVILLLLLFSFSFLLRVFMVMQHASVDSFALARRGDGL